METKEKMNISALKTILIRIRLADWRKIRHIFPSYRGETAAGYILRLRLLMEKSK